VLLIRRLVVSAANPQRTGVVMLGFAALTANLPKPRHRKDY
jgi:hypothetical protein